MYNFKPLLWSILHDETKWNGNCNKTKEGEEEEEHMVYDDDGNIVMNNTWMCYGPATKICSMSSRVWSTFTPYFLIFYARLKPCKDIMTFGVHRTMNSYKPSNAYVL